MFFKLLKEVLLIDKLLKKLGIKSNPQKCDFIDSLCCFDEITKIMEQEKRITDRHIELMELKSKVDYLKAKQILEKEIVSLR